MEEIHGRAVVCCGASLPIASMISTLQHFKMVWLLSLAALAVCERALESGAIGTVDVISAYHDWLDTNGANRSVELHHSPDMGYMWRATRDLNVGDVALTVPVSRVGITPAVVHHVSPLAAMHHERLRQLEQGAHTYANMAAFQVALSHMWRQPRGFYQPYLDVMTTSCACSVTVQKRVV
jgi:hypothetical protein